ncbi:EAL domain-containing protein [Thalassorhabdus alkalitolerans]|uniref:EAL domain-containing protein n=1 Tax=Thalassorhabdus alkalitolerans TaxID=2282697 RepID=A0ABW0YGD1_9BACI
MKQGQSLHLNKEKIFKELSFDSENIWRIFSHMNDGLVITDYKQRIIMVNPAYEKMTGYTYEEVYGKNPKFISSGKTSREAIIEMWDHLNTKGTWTGELFNKRKDEEEFCSFMTVTHVKKEPESDSFFIGIMRDITERKKAEEEASYLAHHDSLTGLPNRMAFEQMVEEAIEDGQGKGTKLGILFLDLDRFKRVNDSFGHQRGDVLLQEVSRRLYAAVKDHGKISRFGGDEFTILVEDTEEKEETAVLLNKIFDSLRVPVRLEGQNLYLTTSIGVSFYPEHGESVEELLKNADFAMYQTKDEGRNNFSYYHEAMKDHSMEQFKLSNQLQEALEGEQLEVYYQMQMDVLSGEPHGVEALIRWNHPEKGTLSPALFLPLAEENGYLHEFDEWVLRKACIQVKNWQMEGFSNLSVSVNVSPPFFESDHFETIVNSALQESGLSPECLCIEITENNAIANLKESIRRIRRLKHKGVKVSLDDFGKGYSSLTQLKQFPVDIVKIDQSFVSQSNGNDENAAIVKMVIDIAKMMKLRVTCEGIETLEHYDLVKKQGCDFAQGYYFNRPVNSEECRELLAYMNNTKQF